MKLSEFESRKKTKSLVNDGVSSIRFCIVNSVNPETMLAEVSLPGVASVLKNVPISGLARFFDSGVLSMPVQNSAGILGMTSNRQAILLGTFSTASAFRIVEKLFPGEVMIQSPGGGYVKTDKDGNVLIGSSAGGIVLLDNAGHVSVWSENVNISSSAQKICSGSIGENQGVREEIYVDGPSSNEDIESLVDKIIRDHDITLNSRAPSIIIEKGVVTDSSGSPEKLGIHENPDDDLLSVTRISVNDPTTGENKAHWTVDSGGNMKISGGILHMDFDKIKMTYGEKIEEPTG